MEQSWGAGSPAAGARGWVAHHNADIWCQTAPVGNFGSGDPVWANWAMGSPWLRRDFWEHYAFSGDKEFLRGRAWPVMKGAAEFCFDWLIDDGKGHLVTAPSGFTIEKRIWTWRPRPARRTGSGRGCSDSEARPSG